MHHALDSGQALPSKLDKAIFFLQYVFQYKFSNDFLHTAAKYKTTFAILFIIATYLQIQVFFNTLCLKDFKGYIEKIHSAIPVNSLPY